MNANATAFIMPPGQPMLGMVVFIAAAVFAAFAVKFVLQASICLLNRVQRYCGDSLRANNNVNDTCSISDREVDSLRANVEAMQRNEMELLNCYSRRRCPAEDVIRATSLRLLAEIQLLRYEKMPRSWAEKCAARRRARRHSV